MNLPPRLPPAEYVLSKDVLKSCVRAGDTIAVGETEDPDCRICLVRWLSEDEAAELLSGDPQLKTWFMKENPQLARAHLRLINVERVKQVAKRKPRPEGSAA